MKNKKYMIISAVLLALIMVLAGCGTGNTAEEDMAIDLGGDPMDPSDDGTDNKLVWNENIPDTVPEFTKGTIVQSNYQGGAFGTLPTVTMGFESVAPEDYEAYISEINPDKYTLISSTDSGGIKNVIYADGENTLSLQYAEKSGQLVLSYSGN